MDVWLVQKIEFFENWFLLIEKKKALTTEIILHFHFHFKVFPEKEREREERAQIGEREEEETSPATTDGAPVQRSHRAARRSQHRIAWSRRSISPPPRDLTFSSAARSQFDRIWRIFLLGFVSFVNECGIDSLSTCLQLRKCMENWVAWLCKAFSVKMFERTKHRNWFSIKRILR